MTVSNSMMTPEQIIGLNQEHLLSIEDNSELLGQKFQCHHEVLVPLAKLIRQSEIDGIPLRVISSYRSFERQAEIWNYKFNNDVELNLRDGTTVNSFELTPIERIKAILHYSAIPGTSRHHWGTDFDIFDAAAVDQGYEVQLVEEEFSDNGPCSRLDEWLDYNLNKFDFFRPYREDKGGVACEPWHISYRPIADRALQEFPLELLKQVLSEKDIGGKDEICSRLESLTRKYVYTICQE
ncbi:M15 family metallopeptidase [Kangiella sediminilitoris]|uniref:Peptidase M15B and M15C DD-carboxypeptidase VanY/endolysin n=1 Tax=Kangiella sediminilitoris TaxID=1144748 RepID=A0A1B3BCC6_9GAMM|nr:M15 family metallopeptidase [Kangiella sediminilitoris]AOE50387.1 Peptidase M15B and M15C DD-carboxypeptidase VanY/endolysin [Kangiella sediminilitoris]